MSQRDKNNQQQKVMFRRIGGRVIPITVGTAGAGVAADAARTKRVYENVRRGITIDRKSFAYQPFVTFRGKDTFTRLGDRLVMKVKGKTAANASYYRGAFNNDPKSFGFSWLGVKSRFRGQGLSKVITRQAAVEIRAKGGRYTWNQVVHPNSLGTNFSRLRDSLWKEKVRPDGMADLVQVTKKQALKNIRTWRDKKGILTSDIFRETKLPAVYRKFKPYRTTKNKLLIAGGLTASAVAAGAYFFLNRKQGTKNG